MMADDMISSYYSDYEEEGSYTLNELWTTPLENKFIVRKLDEEGECYFEKTVDRMKLGQYGFIYDEEGEDFEEWN